MEFELEDLTEEYKTKIIVLSYNLRAELDIQHEYTIYNCTPHLTTSDHCTIQKLNDILDEISCENLGMTVEYLEMLLKIPPPKDIFEEEFCPPRERKRLLI